LTGQIEKTTQFRRYAEECMTMVQDARTPEDRVLLIDMAQRWLELAEHTSRVQAPVDQDLVDERLLDERLLDRGNPPPER
jgi:hypothetical protein